jgi:putative spermidine/putrescine transport system substrate-binding protein
MKRGGIILAAMCIGIVSSMFLSPVPSSKAEEKIVVVVSWGGSTNEGHREASFKPFEKATGIKVIEDAPPDIVKIRAQQESKNVRWDVVQIGHAEVLSMSKQGFLEPIDYSYFDKKVLNELMEPAVHKFGVGVIFFSQGIAWNSEVHRSNTAPQNWRSFWDVNKYPGKRTLFSGLYVVPPIEVALLADGLQPEKLYPLDLERAFRSLDKIKQNVVKWTTSSPEPGQMLISKEADFVMTSYSRAGDFKYVKNAPVDFTFNQGLLMLDYWAVLKNAPHKDNAMKYIAFASDAMRQAELVKRTFFGPVNKRAFDHLSPERAKILPTYPEYVKQQILYNSEYWGEVDAQSGLSNKEKVIQMWNKWVLK